MPTMEPIISGTISMFRRWVLMPLGFSPGSASERMEKRQTTKSSTGYSVIAYEPKQKKNTIGEEWKSAKRHVQQNQTKKALVTLV